MKKDVLGVHFRRKETLMTQISMKLPFLILFSCLFNFYVDGYAQTGKFSINLENVEIRQVFEEIENQSDLKFFYLTEQIDLSRKISVTSYNESVEVILDKVFQSSGITYNILENNLVVIVPTDKDQTREEIWIKGLVTDKNTGEPIPGVNIIIEGTYDGTISDLDGKYSIYLPSENAILIFSFMGYAEQKIPYSGSDVINVELDVETKSLDEVVVIGYGTTAKKDITGSLASIDEAKVSAVPITKIEESIKGRVAGVQVVQGNSAPGSDPIVVIRGRNSINTSTGPLWIVDGFPFAGSINPNDVASMTVLKDASATAIYGSRGSNGVILVTTKKGQRNKQSIDFTALYSISEVRNQVELLNAEQWVNVGVAEADRVEWDGPNTNWPEQIQRTAERQEYNLSYRGGSENSRTYFSLNYKDIEGIIKNSSYESLQGRINTERNFSRNFKISNSLSATASKNSKSNASFEAMLFPPIYDIKDENDNYTYISSVGLTNPVGATSEIINDWKTYSIYNYILGELKILEKLTAKVSLGGSVESNHNQNFTPRSIVNMYNGFGSAGQEYNSSINWTNENQLTYKDQIAENHNITATGFFSQEASRYEGFLASNQLLFSEALTYNKLSLNDTMQTVDSYANKQTLLSLGARFDYNYKNKYYVTASFRRDGSSKFSENNKWANFPSLALSWRINEENFMKDLDQITNLKIRMSYGRTGNQAIPVNRSRLQYDISDLRAVFNNVSQVALKRIVLENPDLTWETTEQYNAGIDLSALENRLSLTLDYYYKNTFDLLFLKNLTGATGGGTMYINKGQVTNQGLEIGLSMNIINHSNFSWTMDCIYSHNRNMVVDLEDTKKISLGTQFAGWINDETHFLSEGYPMGVFYGYQVEGVFADQEDVDSHPKQTAIYASPGQYKLKDINNDGIVDVNDRTIIGNAEPDFIFGFDNNIQYKNLTLSIFIQGSVGNEIYNVHNVALLGGLKNYNRSIDYLNAWSPENTHTHIPKPGAVVTKSLSAYVEDGSYLRLRDISLSYTLPQQFSSKLHVEDLQLSISAQNYLTWTNYQGYDPEVSWNSGNIYQGVDWQNYPSVKSITFGLKVQF